jgi:hypothetical protein
MRSLNDGEVLIRNKVYQTVALRVQKFREAHPDWSIVTQIVHRDADEVVMVATILNDQGRILATGHAEEKRKASQINSTSALENAETSAIGRALAAAGLGVRSSLLPTKSRTLSTSRTQGSIRLSRPSLRLRQWKPSRLYIRRLYGSLRSRVSWRRSTQPRTKESLSCEGLIRGPGSSLCDRRGLQELAALR